MADASPSANFIQQPATMSGITPLDIAVIVPTRNRPDDLAALLGCFGAQTRAPKSITIVDSSDDDGTKQKVRDVVSASGLQVDLVDHTPPSAAGQRNRALDIVGTSAPWVMLIDDDVRIGPDCLAKIGGAIESDAGAYVGFALNPIDEASFKKAGVFRRFPLVEWMGLYSRKFGAVARSGWQTRFGHSEHDREVNWLPTTAAVWNTARLAGERFDEFFEEYSYLEDLEFSYRMGSRGKLAVLAGIAYDHIESPHGRKSQYWFGRREVRNRKYFVRKHGLSMPLFGLAMGSRIGRTLLSTLFGQPGQFQRLRGNLAEVLRPAHIPSTVSDNRSS